MPTYIFIISYTLIAIIVFIISSITYDDSILDDDIEYGMCIWAVSVFWPIFISLQFIYCVLLKIPSKIHNKYTFRKYKEKDIHVMDEPEHSEIS